MAEPAQDVVQALIDKGIDPAIAASLAKSLTKTTEKKAKRKYIPMEALERPKKYIGRLQVTQECHTCGFTETVTRIAQIDPNKPQTEATVPVHICSTCITLYRTMDKEVLISLLLLKDHPNMDFRMMSNKQQIKLAKKMTPEQVLEFKELALGLNQLRPEPEEVLIKKERRK